MSHHAAPPVVERRRRLDWASALLLGVGLLCGVLAGWLMLARDQHPLLLVPSLLAVYTGARHLTKWEVLRPAAETIPPAVTDR